jgi:hypothetical protein
VPSLSKSNVLENLDKKSSSNTATVVEIPNELWEKVQDWYFTSLPESSRMELLSNYILSLALILEGNESHE